MTYREATVLFVVICATVLVTVIMTGCTAFPSDDAAFGTISIPDENDCQYRKGVVSGGGGLGSAVSGGFEIVTITNAELCTQPQTIEAVERLF